MMRNQTKHNRLNREYNFQKNFQKLKFEIETEIKTFLQPTFLENGQQTTHTGKMWRFIKSLDHFLPFVLAVLEILHVLEWLVIFAVHCVPIDLQQADDGSLDTAHITQQHIQDGSLDTCQN